MKNRLEIVFEDLSGIKYAEKLLFKRWKAANYDAAHEKIEIL